MVVSTLLVCAIADLLLFHAILCWKGMTTYDYILANQAQGAQSRLDRILACLTCSRCDGGSRVAISPCQALLTSAKHSANARRLRSSRLVHPEQCAAAKGRQAATSPAHARAEPEAASSRWQGCSAPRAAVDLGGTFVGDEARASARTSLDGHVSQERGAQVAVSAE